MTANAFGVCPSCAREPAHAKPLQPGKLDLAVWKQVGETMRESLTVRSNTSLIALAIIALVVSVTAALL